MAVAVFTDAGVRVAAVGDALGDGIAVGETLAADEIVAVVVEDVVAFVLVSELDA